jgi:cellulose synthase (UDP-forming)
VDGPERRRRRPQVTARPESKSWWAGHDGAVRALAAITLLWGMAYLTWRLGWSWRGAAPVPYAVLVAAELFGFTSLALYAWTGWRMRVPDRPGLRSTPTVDVFVCTYDESIAVLEATLVGCRAMTYPHTTYVLDDGRRADVAALAAELDARYITRPDNSHAKAGNINHALGCTSGELIATLDADHVPQPDFLDATLGYFEDHRVALVQTPHDFSNRDSMQHTRPAVHEQSLFYEVLARGKDRYDAMFWCGSAAVIRRSALLSVGGVLTKTVAEDFHTTIAMHSRGWQSRYHPETLVQGLAPHDLGAFLLQRERWARGNLRVFRTRENPIWCPGLTPAQRLSYLGSLLNYFSGLQRLMLLGVLITTLLTGRLPMSASLATLLGLWLPWAVLAFLTTRALARGRLAAADSTVYGLETMGIYLRALVALVWPRTGRFKVTPKEGIDRGGLHVLRLLGLVTFISALLFVAVGLRILAAAGVVGLPEMPDLALAITVAVGLWELGFLGRTLIPLVRRRQQRVQYRFPTSFEARIANTSVDVLDLSPAGLAFSSPVEWPRGRETTLLTRLPDAHGELHDLQLQLVVRSSIDSGPSGNWRIGCSFRNLSPAAHRLIVEYCYVVEQDDRRHPGRPVRVAVDEIMRPGMLVA